MAFYTPCKERITIFPCEKAGTLKVMASADTLRVTEIHSTRTQVVVQACAHAQTLLTFLPLLKK